MIGNQHEKLLERGLIAGFFLVFLVLSIHPVEDGDYFWHIHVGRQILTEQTLPDRDTFSFTTARFVADQSNDSRLSVVFKQYWLAQIVLYWLHEHFGSAGIVILRALVFAAILGLLYQWGKRQAPWPVSGCLTILTASLLLEYPTERPQLFSFLLAGMVLFLLEKLRCEERWRRGFRLLCLPLLMLVWGNLHGGYLLGIGFCGFYAVGHGLGARRTGEVSGRYLLILLLAAGSALVNPCGMQTFTVFRSSDNDYLAMVYETLSPLAAFRHGDYYGAYWLCLLLAAGSLVILRRRMVREHVLVVAGLLVLSLTGLRYMIFLPMSFPLFIGAYARLPRKLAVAAIALAVWVFLSGAKFSTAGQLGIAERFPRNAVAFLADKFPDRNLYNHYDWGGYLAFMLPGSRVFIDGRGLVPAVAREYNAIKDAEGYSEKLQTYGANLIIMPGLGMAGGKIYPLIKALYGDGRWQLVYWDEVALVFVPTGDPALRGNVALDKTNIFRHVVRRVDRLLDDANRGERLTLLQTKAENQMLLADYAGARNSCYAILKIDKDSSFAGRLLTTLERYGKP
jgi:hypothetical protein